MRGARLALVVVVGVTAVACSSDLPPANVVTGVRVLATSADKPYAQPGETVSLRVLAVDGRADRSTPMQVAWLPMPCVNPRGDDYYACYPAMAQQFAPGVDLSSVLVPGDQWSFTLPDDAIAAASLHPGAADPYGVAFAFVVACAGTVEYVPVDTNVQSPLTTPFGCFDASHRARGPDQFVFGFARVYAFADRRNANPVIDHLTFGGVPVDPVAGIAVPHCTASDEKHCGTTDVDTVVPDASWELDPGAYARSGGAAHEGIWVDYYVTAGRFTNDSAVLFDAYAGRAPSSTDPYAAPLSAGPQPLWVVVHDTRGGASWLQIPLTAN
jgi:hypothetical protein